MFPFSKALCLWQGHRTNNKTRGCQIFVQGAPCTTVPVHDGGWGGNQLGCAHNLGALVRNKTVGAISCSRET